MAQDATGSAAPASAGPKIPLVSTVLNGTADEIAALPTSAGRQRRSRILINVAMFN